MPFTPYNLHKLTYWSFIMFSIFKSDPLKKLNKRYEAKLALAMHAQRNGNIKGYSMITAEAEEIAVQIKALEVSKKP